MSNILPTNYQSNCTMDEEKVLDTLVELKKRSGSYTQEVQRTMVGYQKFDYYMSDFKLDRDLKNGFNTKKRYVLNVPKQLIPISNKEAYKKSNFFAKELDLATMCENPKIFPYSFLIFIDGKIFTTLKLLVLEDLTKLVLYVKDDLIIKEGLELDEFERLVKSNARITIFFIPNSLYATLDTNKFVVSHLNNKIPLTRFNTAGEIGKNSITYTILSPSKNNGGVLYPNSKIENEVIIKNNYYKKAGRDNLINIQLINFRFFDRVIDIPQGGDYFELPIRTHVVPVSSIIAFYEEDGFLKYYHDLEVEYYYPNIYKVKDNEIPLKLLVFYSEPENELPFINELELYYRFFKDSILEKYRNNTIPNLIKEYKEKEYPISINAYRSSPFMPSPLDYKCDTLYEDINSEASNLSIYLENMMKNRKRLKIDVSKINLSEKVRMDTSEEVPKDVFTFDEPQYVFLLTKNFIYESEIRIFVDGEFFQPHKLFSDENFYYIYIPTSKVKADSVIFIEKSINHQEVIDIESIDDEIINIETRYNTFLASDVMILDSEDTFINPAAYSIIINENDEDIEIESTSHKKIGNKFKIKFLDNSYIGGSGKVMLARPSGIYKKVIETESDKFEPLLIRTNMGRHAGHIRIFKNGRLIPPSSYKVKFKKGNTGYNIITFKFERQIGEIYYIEVSPNVYYTQLYEKEISRDGILNLNGIINKPFNLKWFDVYLNGYRLDERKFESITPTRIIIKNVKSNSHLLILEKDWKDDIFKLNTSPERPIPSDFIKTPSVNDIIADSLTEIKEEISNIVNRIEIDDTIEELIPDLIEDIVDPIIEYVEEVVKELFNKDLFLNPDIEYSKNKLSFDLDSAICENDNVVTVFPKAALGVGVVIFVNPDEKEQINIDESINNISGVILDK